jgi:membrane-associated phospholipid phosphatase
MILRHDLTAAALALLVVFATLGAIVSRRPLGSLDAAAVYFRGQATRLAVVFTKSGRSHGMTIACILAIAVCAALHVAIWVPLLIVCSQIVSQTLVELLKSFYKRTRPDYWLVGLEAGHSYPSGHAATATIFFIGWAIVAFLEPLSVPIKSAVVLILVWWALGIAWSRLALGAHYLSDVAGGVLFGAAWLCGLLAFVSTFARI